MEFVAEAGKVVLRAKRKRRDPVDAWLAEATVMARLLDANVLLDLITAEAARKPCASVAGRATSSALGLELLLADICAHPGPHA